jgi:hypothetical protein
MRASRSYFLRVIVFEMHARECAIECIVGWKGRGPVLPQQRRTTISPQVAHQALFIFDEQDVPCTMMTMTSGMADGSIGCGKCRIGEGLSSTATLGCAIFEIYRVQIARKLRNPHSQEWLCYFSRGRRLKHIRI